MAKSRRFSLGIYVLLVCALSWPFQIAGVIWGESLLSHYILNSLSMVMVTAATFIAGKFVFRDGFAGAGWRWGKAWHYLAVTGLVLLLYGLPTLIRIINGSIDPGYVDKAKLPWLIVLPLVFLIPAFGEEFGWRGYMLPRMAGSMGVRRAVLWHAVIWWAWHLPVTLSAGVQAIQASAAQAAAAGTSVVLDVTVSLFIVVIVGAVSTILHGVVFAYIWQRSGSIAVAVAYHAVYDGIRDSLGMTVGLSPAAGWWAVGVLSLLGILLLWKGDWSHMEIFAAKKTPDTAKESAQLSS